MVLRDDAAEIELALPVDLLPLQTGEADGAAARPLDGGPQAHAAVPFEAIDLLLNPRGRLAEIARVLELERPDDQPLRLDRQRNHGFSHTPTSFSLSLVNGSR